MLRNGLTFIMLFVSLHSQARIGLADWSAETPGGNEINNFTDRSIYFKNGTQLDNVGGWYFYEDHIIGWLSDHSGDTAGFFVANESSYEVKKFNTRKDWTEFLQEKRLEPRYWKRWYRGDWLFFEGRLFLAFIIPPFPGFAFMLLFLFLLRRAIVRERFSLKGRYTRIVSFILIWALITWLLDQYPQSF